MQPTDKAAFAAVLFKTWRFYDKTPDREQCADWFDLLAEFELPAIATAFQRHLADPKHGSYLPKPADIFRHLTATQADDGRPGADEAWGILSRIINDERETGVLSEEIREAWGICQPVLDLGDEVGARMTFRESYTRLVEQARQRRAPARWNVTLGQDVEGRKGAIQNAVRQGRITAQHAQLLLPGASVESIDALAGLLTGPDASEADASEADAKRSENLKRLAEILRNASAAADAKREQERQQQRESEAAKKAAIRSSSTGCGSRAPRKPARASRM